MRSENKTEAQRGVLQPMSTRWDEAAMAPMHPRPARRNHLRRRICLGSGTAIARVHPTMTPTSRLTIHAWHPHQTLCRACTAMAADAPAGHRVERSVRARISSAFPTGWRSTRSAHNTHRGAPSEGWTAIAATPMHRHVVNGTTSGHAMFC